MNDTRLQLIFPDNTAIYVDDQIALGREHFRGLVSEDMLDLISRRQFSIFREGHIYFVEDGYMGRPSINGTLLNGRDIRECGKQALRNGDTVGITDVIQLEVAFA